MKCDECNHTHCLCECCEQVNSKKLRQLLHMEDQIRKLNPDVTTKVKYKTTHQHDGKKCKVCGITLDHEDHEVSLDGNDTCMNKPNKPNFIVSDNINLNGTSLQGYIKTTYDEIVKVFGDPTDSFADKSTAEWSIKFNDGTIASIYDYKECTTPMELFRVTQDA